MKQHITLLFCILFAISSPMAADESELPLLANIYNRNTISLNGKWNYIVDPFENGYYNYRYEPMTKGGFFENKKQTDPQELLEYNFDTSPIMDIPSDWNTKDERLFFYEGTVWFKKSFSYKLKPGKRAILYFGAVNYESIVWVNGKKVGQHIGGFTPFNFDVTSFLREGENFIVVKVDNKRKQDQIPTLNFDWWNYGGITRDVFLAEVPDLYIEDYSIKLDNTNPSKIIGWIKLNHNVKDQSISIHIPELKISSQKLTDEDGLVRFEFIAKTQLWSPEYPKLYKVSFSTDFEDLQDEIGFRTIETRGKQILLNGKPVFLRGVSIHEEAPFRQGRAWSEADAHTLLSWAKELGCN